jgi:hypothetical protein
MGKSSVPDPQLAGFNMMPFVNQEGQAMQNMYGDLGLAAPPGAVSGITQAGLTNQTAINNTAAQDQFALDTNAATGNAANNAALASGIGSFAGLTGGGLGIG